MLETLTTLLRGRAARAEEDLIDRNALLLLDQHIRDAAHALEGTRRALAISRAQDTMQRKRLDDLRGRIADLEKRAIEALKDGAEAMAAQAAEAIAELEADCIACERDSAEFAKEAARLELIAKKADRRLSDLRRGRRRAEAGEAIRRLRASGVDATFGPSALKKAEDTLERLSRAQEEHDIAEQAYDDFAVEQHADAVRSRLEAAGYGEATRPTAASVLERLKRASQGHPQ